MNAETQSIHDDGDPKKYWTRIYNMADDDLDPYEYRLLGHYIRWGGTDESLAATAKTTQMGKAKVIKTRQCLQEKGYIEVEVPTAEEARKHQTVRITLVDRWAENMARYTRTSSNSYQSASTNQNQPASGTGTNQNPMKNISTEEQKAEEQILAVSNEPAQVAKPKSKRKPKRTEAEKLAAENADPVFLAVGQSVFGIEDPTILTDSGRKRMRPIVGRSKLLFDRQFASTDNTILRRILVAFAGSFEKGKCPRDYTKFEERFTAYLQSQSQNIRDLLAQPPAQPDLPPVVDEATGQRDYSKEILRTKRMLFAGGAIRAAEGMLEENLKKNDNAA